ncbi:MAG: hypothetical protein ABI782_10255, partial [Anaerolineaceae bacterium]
ASDSSAFAVVGAATQLAFSQQPSNGSPGTVLPTQPTVIIKDALGSPVTTGPATQVTIALTGPGAGILTCTGGLTKTAVNGAAVFTGCSVSAGGAGYGLHATSSPALTATDSSTFTIAGPAAKLAFTQQPSSGIAGTAFSIQPVVAIQDAGNLTVTGDNTTQVTITKTSGPGTLTCAPVTAASGVANFANCTVSAAGTYVLHAASSPLLTAIDSTPFAVTGAATKLAFSSQPTSGTVGAALSPLAVQVQDANSAVVTGDNTTQVTLTKTSGPGTLTCGPITAVNGVATFTNCTVSAAGTYVLHAASSPVLTPADTSPFNVTATPGTVWYFAEGFTGLGWTTELHLLNANLTAATVSVTYLLDSGAPVTRAVSIPGKTERTLAAASLTDGPGPNFAFGVRIISDIPIVAEEQMYAGASGDFAHGTQGATALSNTWYFAEGFTQFGWQTFVLVANPGAASVDVTVTYQVQGGAQVTKLAAVAAGTRQTFLGHVDVPDQAFSVSVSSTGPVVAEMAMYDPGRTIAHRTVGVTGPASTWYLGEGFTGFGWETFISVGNPGATSATVTATFTIDGGAPVIRVITVPAHSRGTFIAHDPVAGVGTGKAFGVYVTSTAPVVVQEVLIDPAPGASRANSTMAAAALASQWSFSGGSSNPGMVTFLTVSNPGLVSASVTATYYFNDATAPVTQLLTIPAQSRGTFASSSGIPANKSFGIVLTAVGSPIVAQEAVYDQLLNRAFSSAGAAGP